MKKHLLIAFVCLILYQTFCSDPGKAHAENVAPDTLSWTWEVSSTVSTRTKTCTMEFSDNLLVNWGDGVTEWIPDSLSSKVITHVYTAQANYVCTAIGVGLSYFKADSRRVLNLDTRKVPSLTYLSCTSNQVSSLDLTRNPLLVSLYCGSNDLSSLVLSQNVKLQTLTCSDNQLTALDVSMLADLKKVTCHTNPLAVIEIHPSGALAYLSCSNCSLTAEKLDVLFAALPVLESVSASKNLYVLNNPGSSSCHSEIAAAKNWTLDRVITQSSFYVPSVTCKTADSAQVNVFLKNTAPAIAFELDILIPDGFVLDTLRSCLASARKGDHVLSLTKIAASAQIYKMMAYSLKTKDSFSGTDGSVLELYFKAAVEIKTYVLDIQHAILIDTLTNSMDISVTDGQMTVKATSLTGDANGDERVDVTDIVNLVAWINGRRNTTIDSTAIDIDGNGLWNVADITKLVLIINSGETLFRSISVRESTDQANTLSLYSAEEAALGNHLFIRQAPGNALCLELCMDHVDEVQAFQADLILPEGVSLKVGQFPQNSIRAPGHLFSVFKVSENHYRLLSYALKPDAPFSGKSGVLATLPLDVADGISCGSYPVILEQPVLTGMDLASVHSTSYDAVITLGLQPNTGEGITFFADRDSRLWVYGKDLASLSVWDMTGKLLFQHQLDGVDHYSVPLHKGFYLVGARNRSNQGCFEKVAVR
ncbi:MAG: hypothetical protein PHS30_03900 [Bacteroidales bacterium]|nr:hypothetical protein [Bacteroidales bacterium]